MRRDRASCHTDMSDQRATVGRCVLEEVDGLTDRDDAEQLPFKMFERNVSFAAESGEMEIAKAKNFIPTSTVNVIVPIQRASP